VYFQQFRPILDCTNEDGIVIGNLLFDIYEEAMDKNKSFPGAAIVTFVKKTAMLRDTHFPELSTFLLAILDHNLKVVTSAAVTSTHFSTVSDIEAMTLGMSFLEMLRSTECSVSESARGIPIDSAVMGSLHSIAVPSPFRRAPQSRSSPSRSGTESARTTPHGSPSRQPLTPTDSGLRHLVSDKFKNGSLSPRASFIATPRAKTLPHLKWAVSEMLRSYEALSAANREYTWFAPLLLTIGSRVLELDDFRADRALTLRGSGTRPSQPSAHVSESLFGSGRLRKLHPAPPERDEFHSVSTISDRPNGTFVSLDLSTAGPCTCLGSSIPSLRALCWLQIQAEPNPDCSIVTPNFDARYVPGT
jgi:hypothetical protein